MPVTLYVEPPGAPLVPGPLHFGLPGDTVNASAPPVPYIVSIDGSDGKTDYSAKYYEPAYIKQVSANYAKVGVVDSRSIKFLGPYQSLHWVTLDNGPTEQPQYNLLQPVPYWNVQIVTPQQLAAYESIYGTLQNQVPSEYSPAGPPNLYLGK